MTVLRIIFIFYLCFNIFLAYHIPVEVLRDEDAFMDYMANLVMKIFHISK